MILNLDTSRLDHYEMFMRVKRLPSYTMRGSSIIVPDEYASILGGDGAALLDGQYVPREFCFDYQADIARIACRKRKFAVFADCGLGKTIIMLEFALNAIRNLPKDKCFLIVCPLMVVPQTVEEYLRWYGTDEPIEQLRSNNLQEWLLSGNSRIGITNYEAMESVTDRSRLGGMALDESSMLKSHYGKHGATCIELGRGLAYKLALTGTPAPNDRIEYANHAVFLDQCRSVNEFLAKYFVNRGQTNERWELRPHALRPFYRDLSHWCIFLTNPAVYGWKDNCGTIPPINVIIDHVELSDDQRKAVTKLTGRLCVKSSGGIGQRGKLARIGKGFADGRQIESAKPDWIRSLLNSEPKSTLVWCRYNDEQDQLADMLPESANIDGGTKYETRMELIGQFKRGERRDLISKPKILGFGLNLQIAKRQVFSTLQDSYEEYYQCVKRSNRYGSTDPLEVRIPVTEIELPMVENALRKAGRVHQDAVEQEAMFRECGMTC